MIKACARYLLPLALITACSSRPAVQEESSSDQQTPPPAAMEQPKKDIWAWDYSEGPRGPKNWSSLNPQYEMCATGQNQSPVNLVWHKPTGKSPLKVSYAESSATLINTGYTLRVEMTPQSQINFMGKDYLLEKMEIRSGSEHSLSGNQMPMELQFYHRSSNGLKQAIVSLFVIKGKASPWFDALWTKAAPLPNFQSSASFKFDPSQLIPPRKTFYHYEGSLTHPPCLEGVQWFVFNTPLQLSAEQILLFQSLFGQNNRPIQPLGDRKVINF